MYSQTQITKTIEFKWGSISQVAPVVRSPPANAGDLRDMGLIPGLERSPREENCNPL